MKGFEIEKKFLIQIENIPKDLETYNFFKIEQGYISIIGDREERVRHIGNKYYHTIKIGTGQIRKEIENEISQEEFQTLWGKSTVKLQKNRYIIPYNNHKIELDIYEGNLKGLIVAEIEFESSDECESFIYPTRFGKDITNDIEFKNRNLALMKGKKIN